jgi:hypothetical protein
MKKIRSHKVYLFQTIALRTIHSCIELYIPLRQNLQSLLLRIKLLEQTRYKMHPCLLTSTFQIEAEAPSPGEPSRT